MGCLVLLLIGALGCAGGAQKAEEAKREAEWAWLQENKAHLDDFRQQLAEAQEDLDEAQQQGEGAPEEEIQELSAKVEALEAEIHDLADELGERLVNFINSDPPVEGEPLTERQLAAIRMKSDEDMVVAREYIEKGGDYARGIGIYRDILKIDPDNEKVQAALEEAEQMRYMTEERFAKVQKGMTQREVRNVLGQVNLRNIRDFPERNAQGWFYPKEGGGAAAIWFEKDRRTGQFKVYQVDFNAVERRESG